MIKLVQTHKFVLQLQHVKLNQLPINQHAPRAHEFAKSAVAAVLRLLIARTVHV
jgi:hypothetical protein